MKEGGSAQNGDKTAKVAPKENALHTIWLFIVLFVITAIFNIGIYWAEWMNNTQGSIGFWGHSNLLHGITSDYV
jgi:hypothetical protein